MAAPLLGVFLAAAAGPIAKKVLVALGIGVISYAGFNTLYGAVQSAVVQSWGQMGGVTLQLLSLAGFADSVGITLGAFSARLALLVVERLGRVAS